MNARLGGALAFAVGCAPVAEPPPPEPAADGAARACHEACARGNTCRVEQAAGDLVTVADCAPICDDADRRRSLGLETPERLRCLRERPCEELDRCGSPIGADAPP